MLNLVDFKRIGIVIVIMYNQQVKESKGPFRRDESRRKRNRQKNKTGIMIYILCLVEEKMNRKQ